MNAESDRRRAALQLTNPPGLYDPAPHGYSHLAMVGPNTRLLLVAGQGGEDERGGFAPDFRQQVRQAFRNLGVAVAAGGAAFADIAKMTVLIVDHDRDKLKILDAEFDRLWPQGALKPARTLIPVPGLALEAMLFEVEAIAVIGA